MRIQADTDVRAGRTRRVVRHAVIGTSAVILLGGLSSEWRTTVEAQGTLNGHTVRLDGSGKLVPWSTPETDAYDRVMTLAWGFLLNDVPTASNGHRLYYLYSFLRPDTLAPAGRNSNPASMFAGFTESALSYYAYSGNVAVVNLARDVLTHHINNGLTPSNWNWPGVPYATGFPGSPTYGTDSDVDGVGVIETDKLGELGTAFLRYYLFSNDVRFRDAAIRSADALASHVRVGDASRSPWPFRVHAQTNAIREEYTANVIPSIYLFDLLISRNLGNVAAYQSARQTAWNWMMQYPMQNNVWSNYFEDVYVSGNTNNWNQLIALETARYLLRFPQTDPNWEAHVRGIIDWVERTFAEPQFGANSIAEQMIFHNAMGSHTARYASVNAMLYEKTGDTAAREKAYRAFNWATYMCKTNGRVIDGPAVNELWFTDGYGDYIKHFMAGLAAVPGWAPPNQSHLVGSTSVVRTVSYLTGEVAYETADAAATDSLRLAFVPQSVTADGAPLAQRTDLAQPGWTFDPTTRVMRLRRTAGRTVRISGSTAPMPAPPTGVRIIR